MSRTLGIIAAVAIVLALGYYAWMATRGSDVAADGATSTAQASVQISTSTISEETSVYKISAAYPQFGIPAIDAQVKKDVGDAVAEIKSYPANPPEMASPQNELDITYRSTYVGPDIIGTVLVISEYTGGAHPNTILSGVNFERTSGKPLLLNDVLPMIGKNVQQLSAACTAQLKSSLSDAMFEEGSNSNPENFSSFIVSKDKVTFIFQPYQVAPYSSGPQMISFDRVH